MSKFYTAEERDQIIEDNMHLVPKVAWKYRHLLSLDELIAAGNLGLIAGVDKYNPTLGYKVSTYVVNWIRAHILSALYENRNVHIPWNKINNTLKRRGDQDKPDSLGQQTPVYYDELVKLELSLDYRPAYLQHDPDDDENPMRPRFELTSSLSAETITQINSSETREQLLAAMEEVKLTNTEKLSLIYRFGLSGEPPMSLQQISNILQYSRMGVHKLQKRALKKLADSSLVAELLN